MHARAEILISKTPRPPRAPLFPYTTLFRSRRRHQERAAGRDRRLVGKNARMTETGGPTSEPEFNPQSCRSEEHTSELQSQFHLVCRLLLEKKNQPAHSVWRDHQP